ncbi:hypothetical protein KIL84_015982, partial [Mauremys mutica]
MAVKQLCCEQGILLAKCTLEAPSELPGTKHHAAAPLPDLEDDPDSPQWAVCKAGSGKLWDSGSREGEADPCSEGWGREGAQPSARCPAASSISAQHVHTVSAATRGSCCLVAAGHPSERWLEKLRGRAVLLHAPPHLTSRS